MNAFPTASPSEENAADRQGPSVWGNYTRSQPLKRFLDLNPLGAIVIAAVGLTLAFGVDTGRLGCRAPKLPESSPEEAVDISLRRLARSRVVNRLQRAQRLNGSQIENQAAIDGELAMIRHHPLYLMIKEKMADHLRKKGYQRIPVNQTTDPRDPMLSLEAETTLHNFIHSLRAFCRAPNEKVAAFLGEHEASFGKSIVARDGAGGYDVAFPFLIQLVFEFPDDSAAVADAVRFVPAAIESLDDERSPAEPETSRKE